MQHHQRKSNYRRFEDVYNRYSEKIRDVVSRKIEPSFLNDGVINDKAVEQYHDIIHETGDGVAAIFPMPNHSVKADQYAPVGNVMIFKPGAKMTAMMFGSQFRIAECTMLFEVIAGKDLSHIKDPANVKRINHAIKQTTIRDGARNNRKGVVPLNFKVRAGIDTSNIRVLNSREFSESQHYDNRGNGVGIRDENYEIATGDSFFEDVFDAGVGSAEERRTLRQYLLDKRDEEEWNAYLGTKGHHLSLVHSDNKVYIAVHVGSEASSSDLFKIAAYYRMKHRRRMDIETFMEEYPWYEMHKENAMRVAKRLAYRLASLMELVIATEHDRKAYNTDPSTKSLPLMGIPSVVQITNSMERLDHINPDAYRKYVRRMKSEPRKLSHQESMAYFVESKPHYAFFNRCVMNPLYHPHNISESILKSDAYSVTRPKYLSPSSSKLHGKYLKHHPHCRDLKRYTVQNSVSDRAASTGTLKQPLHMKVIILPSPDEGLMLFELVYHDTKHVDSVKCRPVSQLAEVNVSEADAPSFLAFPAFGYKKRDTGRGVGQGKMEGDGEGGEKDGRDNGEEDEEEGGEYDKNKTRGSNGSGRSVVDMLLPEEMRIERERIRGKMMAIPQPAIQKKSNSLATNTLHIYDGYETSAHSKIGKQLYEHSEKSILSPLTEMKHYVSVDSERVDLETMSAGLNTHLETLNTIICKHCK